MWRWVPAACSHCLCAFSSALAAQTADIIGSVDSPDPGTAVGMILVKGWVLDPSSVSKVELYVDDQFSTTSTPDCPCRRSSWLSELPRTKHRAGFQTGFTPTASATAPHRLAEGLPPGDGPVLGEFSTIRRVRHGRN